MTLRQRNIIVKQLPESLSALQARAFLCELESYIQCDRPCLVLDCSKLDHMDMPTVHLLLFCLEEAMKRNGDVKLAEVSPEAMAILESSGIEGLFKIFDSTPEAINSFYPRQANLPLHEGVHSTSQRASGGRGWLL